MPQTPYLRIRSLEILELHAVVNSNSTIGAIEPLLQSSLQQLHQAGPSLATSLVLDSSSNAWLSEQ
jgi:hypothetical protein